MKSSNVLLQTFQSPDKVTTDFSEQTRLGQKSLTVASSVICALADTHCKINNYSALLKRETIQLS
ncbi:MAG: hypothetical protein V2I51_23065, partial [Anderseniella sp.]|nr:hypothetical protein [Anderseniella sp.]